MGAIFAELNLQLLSAKILTEGEQVLDIFHILNQHGQPLADENLCRELEQAVIEGLTEQVKARSEEHTSELQSRPHLVCRLLLEKKNKHTPIEHGPPTTGDRCTTRPGT